MGLGFAQQSFKSIFNSDDAHTVFASRRLHDRANHSIQARGIPAASQDANGSVHGRYCGRFLVKCNPGQPVTAGRNNKTGKRIK
jgi:hypothetical protein